MVSDLNQERKKQGGQYVVYTTKKSDKDGAEEQREEHKLNAFVCLPPGHNVQRA